MSESFIHPSDVRYHFTNNVEDVKCYSLTGIARMIGRRVVNALDQRGRNPISVHDLLLLDPYSTDTSSELLREPVTWHCLSMSSITLNCPPLLVRSRQSNVQQHFHFTAHASKFSDFVHPFVCVLHHNSLVHLLRYDVCVACY